MAEEQNTTIANTDSNLAVEADSLTPEETELIKEMMDIGVFYGRSKARTNPKMRKYILTNRSGFSVIDLRKTLESLKKNLKLIEEVVAQKGTILFVGTSPSSKNIVKEVAEATEMPYVTERWLGGTLTNFETISKRINHLKRLKKEKVEGDWDKYTKKEQLDFEKELAKLERLFGGIESLNILPQLLFITNVSTNEIPAKEARVAGIPAVGVINTDANPRLIDHAIPANERSTKSIEFIMNKVREAVLAGKAKQATLAEVKKEEKKEEPKEQEKES